MKLAILTLSVCFLSLSAIAVSAEATVQHFYFLGEQIVSNPNGTQLQKTPILVEKVFHPDQNQIVEIATEITPGRPVSQYPMYLSLNGSKFSITDDKHTISGGGELFGPAWNWTYFKGTFYSTAGYRIEDENFMSDPNVLVARKRIYNAKGTLVSILEITVHQISETVFTGLTNALMHR